MAYVRFGEDGSDVYVYADVNGGISCVACALPVGSHTYADETAIISHLREHIAVRHCVPAYVIQRVLDGER